MPHKTTRNQRLQMVKAYLTENKSVRDIAAENNLSLSTVRYWLHKLIKAEDSPAFEEKSQIGGSVWSDFVELSFQEKSHEVPPASKLQMEVLLPNGIQIKIYQ